MGPPPSDRGSRRTAVLALIAGTVLLAAAVVAVVAVVAWKGSDDGPTSGVAGAQFQQQQQVPARAPAFTADQLAEDPVGWWITNGGSLYNQRYSPLDQIDVNNVQDLKGVWLTHLESGTAAKYSAEAQPIFYDGVLYVPTGEDDVFAVDVATGKIKWKYESKISQEINTVCCGWLSRGVAIGDGKVFIGQLDGTVVALDQMTGEKVWQTTVGRWQEGFTITHAPLYYDGLVIVGGSGGEFSIRGRLQAYDANSGELVWRFHAIPGPGETGHDTWPAGNDAWQHGGAPIWQTPAVDPELGLLYFSTGNASPDLDGSDRAGDNLFTASIVAVEAKTGKYRWHFQQVHHDIWDYDSPSPVVLFDAEFDGKTHKAIAESSKTGWTYVLDRETGKPLLPVEEQRVPQDPVQQTARTQPIPQYESLIPHDVSDDDIAEIAKLARANAKGAPPRLVEGRIFTPFRQEVRVIVPGPQGGVNWQPTSYNPETGLLYFCAMRSVSGYTRTGKKLPEGKQGQVADFGSVFTTTGFGAQTGYFGAFDVTSGEIEWRKRWPESCYSGTVTTGGGLVFVGRNSGHLEAYDAETGDMAWSFQTGAGANSTVTTFMWKGTQYLSFVAGGNSLAATPHGDNLWLFSLDGTVGEVAGTGPGQGAGHAGESPAAPADQGPGDPDAGARVWSDNCSGCHGLSGTGGNGGPDLTAIPTARNVERVRAQVTNGGGGMPAFRDSLTAKEINDVTAYVVKRINK